MVQRGPERTEHAAIVRLIATERFPYPTNDRPTWVTITADQDALPNGARAPSISPADLAVIDMETGQIVMLAIVEDGQPGDQAALDHWLPASRLGQLFLYVPTKHVDSTERLAHELGIRLSGLRGWGLTVDAAPTRPFAFPLLSAFLPPVLRPARFRPLAAAVRAVTPSRIPRPASTMDALLLVLIWAAVTAVSEVLLVFVVNDLMFPTKGAEEAHTIDEAFKVMSYMAAPVFALVVAVLAHAAIRFRADGPLAGDGPAWFGRGSVPWIWLGATTALTLTVMIFPGLTGLSELKGNQRGDLIVNVNAFRWAWDVEYEDSGVRLLSGRDEMVLPIDTRIHFKITASESDVLHSFWIPAFRMKIDAVPGLITEMFVTPDRVGGTETDTVYRVQCAELCGAGHTDMVMQLRVVEQNEFDAWLAEHSLAAGPAAEPATVAASVATTVDEWGVTPDVVEVSAGAVRFVATNTGSAVHELAVIRTDLDVAALPIADSLVDESEVDVRGRVALLDPNASGRITVTLEPGRYALVCNIPGHYALGMRTTFTVTP